jgi:hypothetical protein
MSPRLTVAVLCLSLLAACGGPIETEAPSTVGQTSQAVEAGNGELLNGRTLNGRTLNGSELSGLIVSVELDGARIAGEDKPLKHVDLDRTEFSAKGKGHHSGTDFIGATFVAKLGDDTQIQMKIQGMTRGAGANADLWLYNIAYYDTLTTSWQPACLDYLGNPSLALPVAGRWDYRTGVAGGGSFIDARGVFTFACESGAVGKCALEGYRPWEKRQGKSLAPYHQACTRMLRADFCGNGTSYTENGRSINLYDRLGIQADSEPWTLESLWNEQGASCFRSYNRSLVNVPCYQPSYENTCRPGAPLPATALIATEIP